MLEYAHHNSFCSPCDYGVRERTQMLAFAFLFPFVLTPLEEKEFSVSKN
jgi:hypothetical protein